MTTASKRPPSGRWRWRAAAWAATGLGLVERGAALAFVGFTLYLGGLLAWRAMSTSLWLLVPAAMALASAALLLPSLFGSPDRGLRLGWPVVRRRRPPRRPITAGGHRDRRRGKGG